MERKGKSASCNFVHDVSGGTTSDGRVCCCCVKGKMSDQESVISDKELLKLWRDPTLKLSYRGIRTFQLLLKTDFHISVGLKRLYSVVQQDPIYLQHKRPIRNFARRFYYVTYYGEVFQMDLASMFEYDSYKYFLFKFCFQSVYI